MFMCVMHVLILSQTQGHIHVRQISIAAPWPPDRHLKSLNMAVKESFPKISKIGEPVKKFLVQQIIMSRSLTVQH